MDSQKRPNTYHIYEKSPSKTVEISLNELTVCAWRLESYVVGDAPAQLKSNTDGFVETNLTKARFTCNGRPVGDSYRHDTSAITWRITTSYGSKQGRRTNASERGKRKHDNEPDAEHEHDSIFICSTSLFCPCEQGFGGDLDTRNRGISSARQLARQSTPFL